jgi:polyphosphate kinase
MQRNIYERVEVIFRPRDPALCNQIFSEVIAPNLADTLKTRVLMPDGEYVRLHEARRLAHLRNGHRFNVQEFLIEFTEGRQNLSSVPPVPAFPKLRPHSSTTESA